MKRIALVISFLLSLSLFLPPRQTAYAAVSPDDGYNPGANGSVKVLVVQPDGKTLVGGDFTALGGESHNYIGRLNVDGSLDTAFTATAGGGVRAIALQEDGKILSGGWFTSLDGQARSRIGRLNPDGSLDTAFNPGANGDVSAFALQPDGKIVVVGFFTILDGQPRNRIGRLNSDGSLDTYFNPEANSLVLTTAMQPDGKILVGGLFTTLGGEAHNYIGRINVDGSPDTSFTAEAGGPINALTVQADGKVVVVGNFATLNGVTRNCIGRLNADGSLDTSFNSGADNQLSAVAMQADGKILVGGHFLTLGGQARNRIGRLNPDGSLDTSFNPGANGEVQALAVQSDGKILAGGVFSTLGGQARIAIGRLNPDGSVEFPFNPGTNGQVYALAGQPDGKILVGGAFSVLAGNARNNIGRLNPDGSLDLTFDSAADGKVFALAVQTDGKVLVGGHFTTLVGQPRYSIARLNADGGLDTTFTPETNGTVYAMAVQPDGKILIGGSFNILEEQPCTNLGRLNPDGSLDTTFHPEASSEDGISGVTALIVQPDGKILVGGLFTILGGQIRNNIGRLNEDGSLDTAFDPGADYQISPLAIQSDGKILAGGSFSILGGQARSYIGRLNANGSLDNTFNPGASGSVTALAVQPDGKILVGGAFDHLGGQARNHIGRLNADGSLDNAFNPGANDTVLALAAQADGKILLSGYFTMLDDQTRSYIGRLSADTPALQTLQINPIGTTITWLRGGSGPEVERVTFEQSIDASTYSPLGEGVRVMGGWQLSGLNLPKERNLYIRARGYYATGNTNGSSSVVESIRNVFLFDELQSGPIFTVSTTEVHDDGKCSATDCTLSEAINAANSHSNGASPDEIHFNILSGCDTTTSACTITPTIALPPITDAVIIDGYTQPGASPNTLVMGSNARPLIELSGANNPQNTDGLMINNVTCTLRGLVVNRFPGRGVVITGSGAAGSILQGNTIGLNAFGTASLANASYGIVIDYTHDIVIGGTDPGSRNIISGNQLGGIYLTASASDNLIQGNYLGTDGNGTAALANSADGLLIAGSNNLIGGAVPGARNLISGNGRLGIFISSSTATGNLVQGNYIGTDVTGTAKLGNTSSGIRFQFATNNTIGGTDPAAGNLISGNGSNGVEITDNSTGNLVQGNIIGGDITGAAAPGNGSNGLIIDGFSNNTIGGTEPGAGNLITGNGGGGVVVTIGGSTGNGNRVQGNSISGNAGLGIDIAGDGVTHNDAGDGDTDVNNPQNFPLLTSLSSGVLGGTLNSTAGSPFWVEFFASAACDPSGYGEGEQFLGAQEVTTDSSGSAAFSFLYSPVSDKPYLTATATNAATGDTSEFSPCLPYVTTTTTFFVSPNGVSTYGDSITLTAVVTAIVFENPIPTGQVQFKAGSANLGAPVALDASGAASLTTSALLSGAHTLTAQFLENEAFPSSSSSLAFTINQKNLTVTGINALDKVYDGSSSASLDLSGAALLAVVNGDDVHLNTTGAQATFDNKEVGDTKTVTVSEFTLTGTSASNYTLTQPALTASITPRLLTLTAEDKLKVYGEAVPALTVAYSGFAPGESPDDLIHAPELFTTATRTSPPAAYPITIIPGSPAALNYTFALVDGTLLIEKASTSLLLSASPNTELYNVSITFTAVVKPSEPADGYPGGTVTFWDGDQTLGTALLSPISTGGAEATFVTAALEPGTHTITAAYDGDDNFTASSASTTVTVTDLRIVIQASANPIAAGSSLTLTFTATNRSPVTAANTVMNINLPAGLMFQSATSSAGTPCVSDRTILRCELGDLVASASQMVTVRMVVPCDASGTYTIAGELASPSITPPGGPYPTEVMILTVLPHTVLFLPLVTR